MFIKVRRDTLIILILAYMLIVSGRLMTYMAYASSTETAGGVPISGVIIKGNDIVPTDSIRFNIAEAGFRPGSYIVGDTLVTTKRRLPVSEALENARRFALITAIPGTSVTPIAAADVQLDKEKGVLTVTVIEDFSTTEVIS